MIENVYWLGHAGFKIKGKDVVIYIDPWNIISTEKADLILITHEHFDHLSEADIKKIIKPDTVIVGSYEVGRQLGGKYNVKILRPGEKTTVKGVEIKAVPSYNINKKFHTKESEKVGFVFVLDNISYYHAGDTDLIPEMENIRVDVAFLPVSGTYVMNAKEAAKATELIKPKIAIPMHYGAIVGSEKDALEFKRLAKCEVLILKKS